MRQARRGQQNLNKAMTKKQAKMIDKEFRRGFDQGMKFGYMEGIAAGRFLASEQYIKEKFKRKLS